MGADFIERDRARKRHQRNITRHICVPSKTGDIGVAIYSQLTRDLCAKRACPPPGAADRFAMDRGGHQHGLLAGICHCSTNALSLCSRCIWHRPLCNTSTGRCSRLEWMKTKNHRDRLRFFVSLCFYLPYFFLNSSSAAFNSFAFA